jgi:glucose/arabinose dehydrogenase
VTTSRRSYLLAIGAIGIVSIAACSSGGEPAAEGPDSVTIRTTAAPATTDTTTTATTATTATTMTPAPGPTGAPTTTVTPATTVAPPTTPPRVGTPVVTVDLVGEFDRPVDLAVRPGDDALWIVGQRGTIVRFAAGSSTVMLDVADSISTGNEQGLLGLAFSPDGERAYINRTDVGGTTIIAEYLVTADGRIDDTSERTLLAVDQPYSNHNAGDLAFGPDGMLYIPLGDGGSGGDPERNGSDPSTLLGTIVRIDPTPSGDRPYSIPADNPFAAGPLGDVAGAPEVWAWGLRNPWKIAFDPMTGDLWVPDVGQNQFEEINVVAPVDRRAAGFAVDFGWSAFEGNERFNTDVPDTGATTPPVLTYSHADGCSISGGAVYRGTAIAELEPAFVYSDFCAGTIWALDLEGGRSLTLIDGLDSVTAVREGPDGELYVLERSGSVLRLVPG